MCYNDPPGDHHVVTRANVITITAPNVGRPEVLSAIREQYGWALATYVHSLSTEEDKLIAVTSENLRPKPFVDFVLGIAESLAPTSA